ncbi:serine hydrolase domain-containing protein [Arcicella aquatica]|uniref:Serine hydrolase domain-containing protein n=1 Tax=Arcicella aquatica TaxID=217141 RepID=A0ABU5QI11_9BACT|nr:serine hydrolase domain-containing protein [Arcicella aquatica]MEA5256692.1 serine hydrolase domain-containing protein [Arcicella aquatica]
MIYKKLLFLCLFLCSLGSYQIKAQNEDERLKNIKASLPQIDQIFKAYAEKNHYPAFTYGLVVDGKLIHSGVVGYSNLEKKIPASIQSDFRIASMSKSFTAMAILKLRDEGKLKLDNPAYLYIPELKGQHLLTKDAPEITVRNLLTHSAGFPEDNPWGDRQLAISDEAMLKMFKKGITFSNNPSTAYEYSNMGFAMLGYIIKKVSGKSYQQYINENILKPLGMNHTYWEYSKVPAEQLAHGYRWLNEEWVEQPLLHDGAYGAMGGMITTIEDFSKYVAFHQSVWPASDGIEKGPVKRSSVREMQQPWQFIGINQNYKYPTGRKMAIASAYGYGLGQSTDAEGRRSVGHSGGLPGFGSNWRILQDYGIGVISFSNLTYANAGYFNIQVLDTLVALAKLKPNPIPVSPILKQRINELTALLPTWKNAETSGIFAENFFLDYFVPSLQKEATPIFENAGKILGIKEIKPENNLRGTFVLEGEKANIEISFTLTPENPALIQEYHIKQVSK